MILGVSAEQEELRASVRRFLADRAPLSRVRALMDDGETDWAVWEQAGSQLGLQGLAIPEATAGPASASPSRRSCWRSSAPRCTAGRTWPAPCWPPRPCWPARTKGPGAGCCPTSPPGQTVATLAFTEDGGSWDPAAIRLSAVKDGEAWRLDGHKSFVLDGATAGLILVVATTDAGLSLFAVEGDADG
jgi:alkylation response protein AidB-like acyl-CoA dehydrogenase